MTDTELTNGGVAATIEPTPQHETTEDTMTTEAEAREAITSNVLLTRIGLVNNARTVDHLTAILTDDPANNAADKFRNYLWFGPVQGGFGPVQGSGASANITREVFTSLGRGDECDPDWP